MDLLSLENEIEIYLLNLKEDQVYSKEEFKFVMKTYNNTSHKNEILIYSDIPTLMQDIQKFR